MKPCEKLKAWRVLRGLSQADAGEKAGVSQAAWSDYEAGRKKPRIEQAIRLSELTEDTEHHVSVRDWRESEAARAERAEKKARKLEVG